MERPFRIKSEIDAQPEKADVAFTSITFKGTTGPLNQYVLEKLGIGLDKTPTPKALSNGFAILEDEKAIAFVVTVGNKDQTGNNLRKNFRNAYNEIMERFPSRKLWIPLMGTGAGGLSFKKSFDIIFQVVTSPGNDSNRPEEIILALPKEVGEANQRYINAEIGEWDIVYSDESDNSELSPILGQLKTNHISGENRVFFVGGHIWDGVDQLPRFLADEIWENGHEKNVTKAVNSTKLGDVIFAKTTWVKAKTQGMLTLRAVGLVTENPKDGHILKVNWFEFPERLDLKVGSHYRYTYQRITSRYIDEILRGVLGRYPDFQDLIERLLKDNQSENINMRTLIQSKIKSGAKLWWLNDKEKTWGLHTLKQGGVFGFKIIDSKKNNSNVGDLVMVFDTRGDKVVYGIFEILEINSDGLRCSYIYEFLQKPSIVELLKVVLFKIANIKTNVEIELTEISQELFIEIINTTELKIDDEILHIQNTAQKTKIDNDGAMAPEDFLGFENDIRAFSITLAQKRLVPPVAVALFGNWGTGKSFFMHHLEKNIDHLSKYQGFAQEIPSQAQLKKQTVKPFCEGVVQIKFNAWSYLDTNLWAGLIANIFEKLDEYVSGENVIKKEKDKAQKIIADKLDIVAHERENLKIEIKELTDEQEKLKNDLEAMEALKETIYDSVIEKSIDDLKLEARKQTGGIEETIKEQLDKYGISKQRIEELSPSVLLDEITSWSTFAQNIGKFNKKQLGIALLLFAGLIYFAFDPGNYLEIFKEYLNNSIVYFTSICGPIFIKVYQSYSKFKTVLKPVIEYKNKFNESFETVKLDYDKSLVNLNGQLATNSSEIFNQKERLHEKEKEITDYNHALKHSVTKRAFFDFIQRKANEESYESHLGLISIIRRDFEKLSGLFEEVNIPDNLPIDELKELAIRQNDNEDFRKLFSKPLDRIILYIDDLDRCDDDKVLEVLEAVHLLMAFPLFIVVVGVDKRCVSNALRYRNILKYTSMTNVTPKELKKEYKIDVIEPEEYLEKIFQIPFRLKAAKPEAIKGLIGSLLKNEIEIEHEEPQQESDSSTLGFVSTKPQKKAKIKKIPTTLKPVYVAPEDLLLNQTELEYLKEVSIIVGDTPRTIKRFINIYRIIRAHEQLNYRKKEKDIDFLIIMFVLGLGIGNCRDKSILIFENCIENKDKNLKEVLELDDESAKILLMIEESITLKLLLTIPTSQFNKYIQFVNRFSFN